MSGVILMRSSEKVTTCNTHSLPNVSHPIKLDILLKNEVAIITSIKLDLPCCFK